MYDAIVVGGRCAGSPLAMLLARHGHRVLLVDRTSFPSDTMSTHFIQSPGMVRLARWGLADKIFESGCPPVTGAKLYGGGEPLDIEMPAYPGVKGLAAPRRHILDKILVDAAVEAGAELNEGVTVTGLLREGERVTGIEGYTSEGPIRAEGRVVVGADGRNSTVAQLVGAPFRRHHPERGCGYYSYFAGVENDGVEMHLADGVFCVSFPTHDDALTIAVVWPGAEMKEVRKNLDERFLATLDNLGTLGERVRGGRRIEKYVGLCDIANYLRHSYGPGWALVGDSMYFKDPAPADGISDAFRGADLLAEALDDVLSGRASEEDALRRYQDRFDELAIPLLDQTVIMASEERSPQERLAAFITIRMLTEGEAMELPSEEVSV